MKCQWTAVKSCSFQSAPIKDRCISKTNMYLSQFRAPTDVLADNTSQMADQQVAVQVNTVYRAPTGATSLIRNTKQKYERNWHIQNCETRDAFQPKPVCTFHDWLQIDNKQRRRQKLSLIYNATQSSWDDDDNGLSRADWTLISPQSQHSYRIPNITSLHNGTHCSMSKLLSSNLI